MKKFFIVFLTLSLLALVCFKMYAHAVEIGILLRQTSPYLEYTFYILLAIVVYYFIISPIIKVLLAPYYSVAKYCDEEVDGDLKRRARRLMKYGNLTEEDIKNIKESMNDKEKLSKRLYIIYSSTVKKNIDEIVINTSRDTFIVTAVSQKSFVDMLMVLVNNFRMIKKIIMMCGFRPTFIRTVKLYAHVFKASLIADGAQQIEVSTLISTSIQGALKVLTDSAVNGAINAFFMLRIGMLTKNFLYAQDPIKMSSSIRNNSFVEAFRLFPSIITSLITSPIKGVANLFKSKDKSKSVEGTGEELELSEEVSDIKWKHKPIFFK